jgi:hypothetical protein
MTVEQIIRLVLNDAGVEPHQAPVGLLADLARVLWKSGQPQLAIAQATRRVTWQKVTHREVTEWCGGEAPTAFSSRVAGLVWEAQETRARRTRRSSEKATAASVARRTAQRAARSSFGP